MDSEHPIDWSGPGAVSRYYEAGTHLLPLGAKRARRSYKPARDGRIGHHNHDFSVLLSTAAVADDGVTQCRSARIGLVATTPGLPRGKA